MAAKKYAKYLYNDFITEGKRWPNLNTGEPMKLAPKRLGFEGREHFGLNYWMRWTYVTEPFQMESVPHSHEYDQCAHFYGGDPAHIDDFQAEVWFYLGDEGEKQVITKPTVVYIPKGMTHCPLIYKKIDKPIIFQNVCFTTQYVKTLDTGETVTHLLTDVKKKK